MKYKKNELFNQIREYAKSNPIKMVSNQYYQKKEECLRIAERIQQHQRSVTELEQIRDSLEKEVETLRNNSPLSQLHLLRVSLVDLPAPTTSPSIHPLSPSLKHPILDSLNIQQLKQQSQQLINKKQQHIRKTKESSNDNRMQSQYLRYKHLEIENNTLQQTLSLIYSQSQESETKPTIPTLTPSSQQYNHRFHKQLKQLKDIEDKIKRQIRIRDNGDQPFQENQQQDSQKASSLELEIEQLGDISSMRGSMAIHQQMNEGIGIREVVMTVIATVLILIDIFT